MTEKHDYQAALDWAEKRLNSICNKVDKCPSFDAKSINRLIKEKINIQSIISCLETMIRIERENLVIVPKFPTREMQSAAAKLTLRKDWEDIHQNEVYQAMIKAAIDNGANHYEVMNIIAEKGE